MHQVRFAFVQRDDSLSKLRIVAIDVGRAADRARLRRALISPWMCVGPEAAGEMHLVFVDQRLPGTTCLDCRESSGLIRARRSLALPTNYLIQRQWRRYEAEHCSQLNCSYFDEDSTALMILRQSPSPAGRFEKVL